MPRAPSGDAGSIIPPPRRQPDRAAVPEPVLAQAVDAFEVRADPARRRRERGDQATAAEFGHARERAVDVAHVVEHLAGGDEIEATDLVAPWLAEQVGRLEARLRQAQACAFDRLRADI